MTIVTLSLGSKMVQGRYVAHEKPSYLCLNLSSSSNEIKPSTINLGTPMINIHTVEPKDEITMPRKIRFRFDIEEGARMLFCELKSISNGERNLIIYQTKQLAGLYHVSASTIRKWINQLCSKNLIRLEKTIVDGRRCDAIRITELSD